MSLDEQIAQLRAAIAAQENLRPVLGDETVNSIVSTLRQRLAEMEAQQPRGEQRKLVTVLFADLSGFNALAEQMDAEDVGALINAAWERLDAVVAEYGGRIDKHVGDAIMALWGADQAREDDAERAVRAALAMQQAARDSSFELQAAGLPRAAKLEATSSLRIGINTGPALLGAVGMTQEFTAMGDTVNLASRLQQIAPVGDVLVSHETYQLVRGLFEMQAQEPVRVKGKAELVRAYAVVQAARGFRMRTRRVEGIRDAHGWTLNCKALQEAFAQAMTHSQTKLAVVVGEVGVGKSRCCTEFEKWLRLWPDRSCISAGGQPQKWLRSYRLMHDLFREQFDILDNDEASRCGRSSSRGWPHTWMPSRLRWSGGWWALTLGRLAHLRRSPTAWPAIRPRFLPVRRAGICCTTSSR
jgi:class 3 adenylate cyclase